MFQIDMAQIYSNLVSPCFHQSRIVLPRDDWGIFPSNRDVGGDKCITGGFDFFPFCIQPMGPILLDKTAS